MLQIIHNFQYSDFLLNIEEFTEQKIMDLINQFLSYDLLL